MGNLLKLKTQRWP